LSLLEWLTKESFVKLFNSHCGKVSPADYSLSVACDNNKSQFSTAGFVRCFATAKSQVSFSTISIFSIPITSILKEMILKYLVTI